mmetsp:Transcript_17991/g.72026  ORF Transcript_17991/g.72026 Transcript_17991/m.72026 type:complete len:249 (+) Transcript_17991:1783-2529(+)
MQDAETAIELPAEQNEHGNWLQALDCCRQPISTSASNGRKSTRGTSMRFLTCSLLLAIDQRHNSIRLSKDELFVFIDDQTRSTSPPHVLSPCVDDALGGFIPSSAEISCKVCCELDLILTNCVTGLCLKQNVAPWYTGGMKPEVVLLRYLERHQIILPRVPPDIDDCAAFFGRERVDLLHGIASCLFLFVVRNVAVLLLTLHDAFLCCNQCIDVLFEFLQELHIFDSEVLKLEHYGFVVLNLLGRLRK